LSAQVIRSNELQVWFLAEHLVDVPVVRVDQFRAAASRAYPAEGFDYTGFAW